MRAIQPLRFSGTSLPMSNPNTNQSSIFSKKIQYSGINTGTKASSLRGSRLRFQSSAAENTPVNNDALHIERTKVPIQQIEKTNTPKLEMAQDLSKWMTEQLNQKKAVAAVVARNGWEEVQRYDETGMAHSGLAIYDDKQKKWIVYNLLQDTIAPQPSVFSTLKNKGATQAFWQAWQSMPSFKRQDVVTYLNPLNTLKSIRQKFQTTNPPAKIWCSDPVDFFYDGGEKRDALLLIPSREIQERLRKAIHNGQYQKLHFTPKYNLVSEPHSNASLNCNKWVLMNLIAAQHNNYHHQSILDIIKSDFRPGHISMNPLIRFLVVRMHRVLSTALPSDEIPLYGPIHTIQIKNLYHQGNFEDKIFFIPRKLKHE